MKNLPRYRRTVRITYIFVYNFLVGVALVSFASKGLTQTLLFFLPFLLYIIVEILPQEFEFKGRISKVFYSVAPLLGASVGINFLNFIIVIFGKNLKNHYIFLLV